MDPERLKAYQQNYQKLYNAREDNREKRRVYMKKYMHGYKGPVNSDDCPIKLAVSEFGMRSCPLSFLCIREDKGKYDICGGDG